MLTMDDNSREYKVMTDPSSRTSKRRFILLFCLALLVTAAIGIVIGYFIGRSAKTCDEGKIETTTTPEESKGEFHKRAVEQVSTEKLRSYLEYFTKVPHIGGSTVQREYGEHLKKQWKEFGMDKVELKKYDILLSFPEKPGSVSIVLPNGTEAFRSAPQEEFLIPEENNSNVVPPFNAYSPNGTVKGKLVYANYGREKDFTALASRNISVEGKIVLMRYGKGARSTKHRRASNAGAIGAIYFMDPQEYAKRGVDKVYPDYNWLPKSAVQRGTILEAGIRGDPLTPGYPSIDGIYRRPLEDAKKTLPAIPVHPISYQDAEPLLRILSGTLPSDDWQGGLNFPYGLTMAENDTREIVLTVNTKLEVKEVYNVIGVINGSEEPDRLVMLGNHRDAWVFGAADASSGTAALLEVARVLGEQLKKGWKPRRSIVFCSWGAEEPQYMGSVEFLEEFSKLISDRVVAYLNVDMSVDGNYTFRAKSMPILDWALTEATKQVPSPRDDGESTFDEWIKKLPSTRGFPQLPYLQDIAAGSDYTSFYQRLGIPCVDIRYTYDRKTASNPLYHTVHDNYWWMSRLIDPEFKFHQVTTRVWTQLTMAIADAVILPFNVSHYGAMLTFYTEDLKDKYGGAFNNHSVDLADLDKAIEGYKEAATELDITIQGTNKNAQMVQQINERLMRVERAFVNHEALVPAWPLRRHAILLTGLDISSRFYGGIFQAIYRAQKGESTWEDVKKQVSVVVYAVQSATQTMKMSPLI